MIFYFSAVSDCMDGCFAGCACLCVQVDVWLLGIRPVPNQNTQRTQCPSSCSGSGLCANQANVSFFIHAHRIHRRRRRCFFFFSSIPISAFSYRTNLPCPLLAGWMDGCGLPLLLLPPAAACCPVCRDMLSHLHA